MIALTLGNSGSASTERLLVDWVSGSGGQLRLLTRTTSGTTFFVNPNTLSHVRVRWSGTTLTANLNGGADVVSAVEALALADYIWLGSRSLGDHFSSSIIALRDNNGQILGASGAGFNVQAF